MATSSIVLGLGATVPSRTVTNAELAPALGTTAAAIEDATGIARRHWAGPDVGPSGLGRDAALAALADAGREPGDVDFIVFATMTPDVAFPGSGCFLQEKLGCDTVGAMDVRAQCAGYLFALLTADQYLRAGAYERVLVVGAEVFSTALEHAPRAAHVTPRLGDGGGAMLLGGGDAPGLVAIDVHTDPTGYERFWCEYPSSRDYPSRFTREKYEQGLHYYVLDPDALHRQAEPTLTRSLHDVLAMATTPQDAVRLFVVSYLDPRVARRAADAAGIPAERVVAPAEDFGHVGAAAIPMAIARARDAGRVGRGDLVCCVAFGAGISWGGAVIRL